MYKVWWFSIKRRGLAFTLGGNRGVPIVGMDLFFVEKPVAVD